MCIKVSIFLTFYNNILKFNYTEFYYEFKYRLTKFNV